MHMPQHRSETKTEVRLVALNGIEFVSPGDNLLSLILSALIASNESLKDGDIIVLAQKIVSKAEGRHIPLATVRPSQRANDLAIEIKKDPRVVQLILNESSEVVRKRAGVLIVSHRLGFVMANAGIDMSNVSQSGEEVALLLPENPDQTCHDLKAQLHDRLGVDVGVMIIDSHGRAFRNGTVGVAIGTSGVPTLSNLRGKLDLFGRPLQTTEVGFRG